MALIYRGFRNDICCQVGKYDPSTATSDTALLGDGGDVSISSGLLTLPATPFADGDAVFLELLAPDTMTFPEGWNGGTIYRVKKLTVDTVKLLPEAGATHPVIPTTTGSGNIRLVKVTELVNSKSIANSHEFEWSYDGFNCRQLAYDLIADVIGEGSPDQYDYAMARTNVQSFAETVVYGLPHQGWTLTQAELQGWLRSNVEVRCDFAAAKTYGSAGATIEFKPLVAGYGLTYQWDFGNGTTSTSENPTASYPATGKFNVTLAVSNGVNYATKTRTEYIQIV